MASGLGVWIIVCRQGREGKGGAFQARGRLESKRQIQQMHLQKDGINFGNNH